MLSSSVPYIDHHYGFSEVLTIEFSFCNSELLTSPSNTVDILAKQPKSNRGRVAPGHYRFAFCSRQQHSTPSLQLP